MSAFLTERLQRGPARLAALCCAGALMFSALALAGPVGKAQAIWWENDQVTVDQDAPGILVTIKSDETAALLLTWAGPGCDKDVTGDGTSGSGGDRAMCVLDVIRAFCPQGLWPPAQYVSDITCNSVTSHDEWDDIDGALHDVAGGEECLAVHLNSTESGPWNWTARDISEDECA